MRLMRRAEKGMSPDRVEKVLRESNSGVLSVAIDGVQPYGIPVNYVYDGEAIYIHCASEGQKLDAIRACDKTCFTIIAMENVIPQLFTSSFESVIVFGKSFILKPSGDNKAVLKLFIEKYAPDYLHEGLAQIDKACMKTTIIKMVPSHKSGKANRRD